jgi:hypothetical protein
MPDPRARDQARRRVERQQRETNARASVGIEGAREQMTPEECYAGLIADAEDRRDQDTIDALRRLAALERAMDEFAAAYAALERENSDLCDELRLLKLAAGSRADRAALRREALEAGDGA